MDYSQWIRWPSMASSLERTAKSEVTADKRTRPDNWNWCEKLALFLDATRGNFFFGIRIKPNPDRLTFTLRIFQTRLLCKYLADQGENHQHAPPACTCPTRKKLICSGEGLIPGIFPLNSLSKKIAPVLNRRHGKQRDARHQPRVTVHFSSWSSGYHGSARAKRHTRLAPGAHE